MTAPLRMVFARDGWERVKHSLDQNAIEPVLIEPDGTTTFAGKSTDLAETGFTASWFSPDFFMLRQDQLFLDQMVASSTLRWMQAGRAGYDDPAFAKLAAKDVKISMSNAPAAAIGEYVIAAALDQLQRGPERRAAQAERRWQSFPFREIARTRWLCIGYGEIGRNVAQRARALGAHVTGVRRSGGSDAHADEMVTPAMSAPALASADVVVLSVPLTPENDGTYDAAFFGGFKPGALFINVGRGQLLDEAALKAALDSEQVGHAVVDVTRVEPLPADEWHWVHPKVTLTGHTAALGSGLMDRTDAILVDNVARYLSGSPLMLELDPKVFA